VRSGHHPSRAVGRPLTSDNPAMAPASPLARVWFSGCKVVGHSASTSLQPQMRGMPDIGRRALHDRDAVTRFQHRRKINSILIRNTVVPTAPHDFRKLLAHEGVKSEKPGVVMSKIPMDVQRRCEQRWAARFSRPTESAAPRNQRPEKERPRIGTPDKSKRKTHQVEAAGSIPL
jgi:hypothetical protein